MQRTRNQITWGLGRAALILAATLFLGACRQAPNETVVATPAVTEATPAAASDAWSEIQDRGELIVGTSADYAPFAYYNDDLDLEGYDVALIRAIGEKLGLPVDIRDMAFDGLAGALEVGQIDAAVAAISVTDERRAFVDFSNIYFVSEGAALSAAGSGIRLTAPQDLAAYRVGVQTGTIYEQWVQRALVEPGLMDAANVFTYDQFETALDDLSAGRIDLVVADALPLEVAAQSGPYEIAGRDLNPQSFAIAVPNGSTLLAPINDALAELEAEGVLAELADRYLDLQADELLPLPEPQPEPPAAEAARAGGCVDAMALVADLSPEVGPSDPPAEVAPGQPFQKVWQLRNSGTCTWTTGYILTFVGGNVPQASMGGRATPLQSEVAPGTETEVTVNLVAPLIPGVYQGFWTMRNPNGLLFGDRLEAAVTVTAVATPTPEPTSTASPNVRFTVDRSPIRAGECVTFTWETTGAAAVFFSAQGQPWQQNPVAASGSEVACLQTTTTYDLRVVWPDGSTDIRSLRVDVQPAPNAPSIVQFSVSPSFQVTAGACVDVVWRVQGDITTVRVSRDDVVLWPQAPLAGTSRDCPPVGRVVYAVDVTGPDGTARAQSAVTVVPPPTSAPAATATSQAATPRPPGPANIAFAVTPSQIAAGGCVTLSWSVSGAADRVQIKRNGVIVLDAAPVSGSVGDCLSDPGTYTYRIEASNNAGPLAFQQASVVVGTPPPTLVGGWRLTLINGARVIAGTEITAIFGDSGNLSGSAGCNAYTTGFQTSGNNALSVGPVSTGNQFCGSPAGVMEQENLYTLVLGSATGYTIDGRALTIRSARGTLEFENLASPR